MSDQTHVFTMYRLHPEKREEIVDFLGEEPVVHVLWYIPLFLFGLLFNKHLKENETDMVLFLGSGRKIDWVISTCLKRSIRPKGAKHLPYYEPEPKIRYGSCD